MHARLIFSAIPALLLVSCGEGGPANVPGDTSDEGAFSGIAENAVIALNGTEPFWGGTVHGDTFNYTTPENIDGTPIAVTRFAGRGGVSFSGALNGRQVDLAVTPGECSDGMSDRTYPYVATLQIGSEQRSGCASVDGGEAGQP